MIANEQNLGAGSVDLSPDQINQIEIARTRVADLRALHQSDENIEFSLGLEGFAAGAISAAMGAQG